MKLGEALEILGLDSAGHATTAALTGVECRPRMDIAGKAFFAFPEYHDYQRWWPEEAILKAVQGRGAAVVFSASGAEGSIKLEQTAHACALLAKAFYGRPDTSMDLVGVTGTNGKTTTTLLIAQAMSQLLGSAASLGTLGTFLNGREWEPAEYTTDLSVELYRKLASLRDAGAKAVAMEVSSHALALQRVAGAAYKVAVLTNVTRDHLDFHGTLEAYQEAKGLLFRQLESDAVAVLPTASPMTPQYAALSKARVMTFGREPWADVKLLDCAVTALGTDFKVAFEGNVAAVHTDLVGHFQLQNVLSAGAALLALGLPFASVWKTLSGLQPVPGRMEKIDLPHGALAVIDYAHNPDGLEVVAQACRQLEPKALRIVFGCGGDRDKGKRPLMGEIAARLGDDVWITSDNPRTEDPEAILDDIVRGTEGARSLHRVSDRKEAILGALRASQPGDLVLIAGKGHEAYQLIGEKKFPFSDRSVVEEWIREGV